MKNSASPSPPISPSKSRMLYTCRSMTVRSRSNSKVIYKWTLSLTSYGLFFVSWILKMSMMSSFVHEDHCQMRSCKFSCVRDALNTISSLTWLLIGIHAVRDSGTTFYVLKDSSRKRLWLYTIKINLRFSQSMISSSVLHLSSLPSGSLHFSKRKEKERVRAAL